MRTGVRAAAALADRLPGHPGAGDVGQRRRRRARPRDARRPRRPGALRGCEVDPACLILEVTENAVLEDLHGAIATFDALQRAGRPRGDRRRRHRLHVARVPPAPADRHPEDRPTAGRGARRSQFERRARREPSSATARRCASHWWPRGSSRRSRSSGSTSSAAAWRRDSTSRAPATRRRWRRCSPGAASIPRSSHSTAPARSSLAKAQAGTPAARTLDGCTSAKLCVSSPSPPPRRRAQLVARAHARPGTADRRGQEPRRLRHRGRSLRGAGGDPRCSATGAPDIAILAEESGGLRHERMWVIDPVGRDHQLRARLPRRRASASRSSRRADRSSAR